MKKKILSMILCCAMVSSIPLAFVNAENESAAVQQATETMTVPDNSELRMMKALELIDAAVLGEHELTREETAVIAVRILGIESVDEKSTHFSDVTGKNAGYIDAAAGMGILAGDGNGHFRPEDKIKTEELVCVFVRVMGYRKVIEQDGGTLDHYMQFAGQNGLLDGVSAKRGGKVIANEAAKLFANMLDMKMFNAVLTDQSNAKTLMEFLEMNEIKGIVTENDVTGLYSNRSGSKGYVRVGNIRVEAGESSISNMLGKNVRVFTKTTDDDYMAVYAEEYRNNIIELNIDDIITDYDVFKNNELVYYEDRREREVDLTDGFALLFNGICSDVRTMSLFTGGSGNLILIDNNNDGDYDVISVRMGVDYLVDSVYESKLTISDKLGKDPLDLSEEADKRIVITNEAGDILEFGAIIPWSVITVYDSSIGGNGDVRLLELVVSNKTINGQIESINNEDVRAAVVIDGTKYYVSKSYVENTKNSPLTVGSESVFYVNYMNEICGRETDILEKLGRKYGILIKASYDNNLDEAYYRIYGQDGILKSYVAADRVNIDGTTCKKQQRATHSTLSGGTLGDGRMVIKYELDEDGNVSYIDTASEGNDKSNDTLKKVRTVGEPALKFRSGVSSFGNYYNIDSQTVTFYVPQDSADVEEYDNVFQPENDKDYSIEVYVEENPLRPTVIVSNVFGTQTLDTSSLALFIKSRTAWDEAKGESSNVIDVVDRFGAAQTLKVDEDLDISALEEGDAISYQLNSLGEIKTLMQVYDLSKDEIKVTDSGFASQYRVVSGEVYQKIDNTVSILRDGANEDPLTETLETRLPANYMILVYDTEYEEARTGTIKDIIDRESYGTGSKIIVTDVFAHPSCILIYN